jgi:hypothetical protein
MSEEAKGGLLPAMAAIAVWMFALALIGLVSVTMHKLPLIYVVLCAAFAAAGQGLLRLQRWGWALTLAAVFCSAMFGMWMVVKSHQLSLLVMTALNLVFFLYLVRPEVRARLR